MEDIPFRHITEEMLLEAATHLVEVARSKGVTLSAAESCTGGNIAHAITLVAGCSDLFYGSAVTYSNNAKSDILGVDPQTIEQYGAVSRQVVEQMACGAAQRYHTDCAVATSGIAGPGGAVPGKPVGTVWTAILTPAGLTPRCLHFTGTRAEVIAQTTYTILTTLASAISTL